MSEEADGLIWFDVYFTRHIYPDHSDTGRRFRKRILARDQFHAHDLMTDYREAVNGLREGTQRSPYYIGMINGVMEWRHE